MSWLTLVLREICIDEHAVVTPGAAASKVAIWFKQRIFAGSHTWAHTIEHVVAEAAAQAGSAFVAAASAAQLAAERRAVRVRAEWVGMIPPQCSFHVRLGGQSAAELVYAE
jgi:hypothetical protein